MLDAGLGGLTVAASMLARQPDLDILYLGDCRNVPFNTKGLPWITRRAQALVNYLAPDVDDIVLACNTISTIHQTLSGPKCFEIIEPAVTLLRGSVGSSTLVLVGTPTTLQSERYRIAEARETFLVPCRTLAALIESRGPTSSHVASCIESEVAKALPDTHRLHVTVVLACTHYPLARELVCSAVARRLGAAVVDVIDPGEILARSIDLKQYRASGCVKVVINDTPAHRDRAERILSHLELGTHNLEYTDLP